MNTEAEIFSAPKTPNTGVTESLTQRLYPTMTVTSETTPFSSQPNKSIDAAYNELHRLANSAIATETASTSKFIATSLGIDSTTSHDLEQRIQAFQSSQTELIQEYHNLSQQRSTLLDHCLYILQGWHFPQGTASASKSFFETPFTSFLLTEHSRQTSGGFFLRWNGKGIVINPGRHFVDFFHRQGLHIKDIDFVIVTKDDPEAYIDVKEIYELNRQLNKISPELQVIHYYLNSKAHQELSSILKPYFRQARHTIHNLELFLDSPDVEKIELGDGIQLNYFLAESQEIFTKNVHSKQESHQKNSSTLGIRLNLQSYESKGASYRGMPEAEIRIGYVSGVAWSPLLAHHLGSCDLLLTGFGNTHPNDYGKLSYNTDSLGYHGTFSLLEEVSPRLMLCSEFEGREGDIRIEIIKKMRQEYAQTNHSARNTPVVLPADIGLLVDLKTLHIQCSVTQAFIDPTQVHVVKLVDGFGNLRYLAPICYI